MTTKFLGKTVGKTPTGFKVLDPIERGKAAHAYGIDYWNAYEFNYLDDKRLPVLKVLQISIPSSSTFTVESKSLKLYLNAFYKKSFSSDKDVLGRIIKDLSKLTTSLVEAKFLKKFSPEPEALDINTTKRLNTKPLEVIKFTGFRSICPVTSQPDFANIYISSDLPIDIKWLLSYLVSYRDKGDFHEQCIENIYKDIAYKYKIIRLEVCGRFLRRGGIDINPIRSTHKKLLFSNFREFNQ